MFRALIPLRILHETDGIDEITSSFGNVWSLWDLEYLYSQIDRLRDAQKRAITLCLVHGMLEREAAISMGVGENNPVGMYATLGLKRLLDMQDRGELPRFVSASRSPEAVLQEAQAYHNSLAAFIRSKVRVEEGHWLFPHPPGREPTVLVRTLTTSSGFHSLHPRTVLFENEHGASPPGTEVVHDDEGPAECINPRHATRVLTAAEQTRLRTLLTRRKASLS